LIVLNLENHVSYCVDLENHVRYWLDLQNHVSYWLDLENHVSYWVEPENHVGYWLIVIISMRKDNFFRFLLRNSTIATVNTFSCIPWGYVKLYGYYDIIYKWYCLQTKRIHLQCCFRIKSCAWCALNITINLIKIRWITSSLLLILWQESLNGDGQQFNQYQQNKQPLTKYNCVFKVTIHIDII
jgi:hypothetical protein